MARRGSILASLLRRRSHRAAANRIPVSNYLWCRVLVPVGRLAVHEKTTHTLHIAPGPLTVIKSHGAPRARFFLLQARRRVVSQGRSSVAVPVVLCVVSQCRRNSHVRTSAQSRQSAPSPVPVPVPQSAGPGHHWSQAEIRESGNPDIRRFWRVREVGCWLAAMRRSPIRRRSTDPARSARCR